MGKFRAGKAVIFMQDEEGAIIRINAWLREIHWSEESPRHTILERGVLHDVCMGPPVVEFSLSGRVVDLCESQDSYFNAGELPDSPKQLPG